jgi:hypothetical protein
VRRLQNSRFFIAERPAEPVLVLEGVTSEWLFASGFWKRINHLMGTMFDQFEGDEAEPATLNQIACEMDCHIRELEARSDETIRFVCGWSGTGEPHTIETPRANLISQLAVLRTFLASSSANGDTLELSL